MAWITGAITARQGSRPTSRTTGANPRICRCTDHRRGGHWPLTARLDHRPILEITVMMLAPRVALLLLCGVVAASTAAAQELPATAADRFALLDRNGDGRISRDEYDGDAFFRVLDADHNYRVTVDEVQAVLGPQRDGEFSAAEWVRITDLNGDGELSAEEMRRSSQMRFQSLDANHDENLELSELQMGVGRR